jgi:hypothetical protein
MKKISIRSAAFVALALAASAVMAAPPSAGEGGPKNAKPTRSAGSQLPGGTEHIPAGVGTATPPALANRTHHARRQDALQHAQTVINSREQLRDKAGNNGATAP